MIEVSFQYPLIMKMKLISRFRIEITCQIDHMKQMIFDDFWRCFDASDKHGTYQNVSIYTGNERVETQEKWQECLKTNHLFVVIFQKTPHGALESLSEINASTTTL